MLTLLLLGGQMHSEHMRYAIPAKDHKDNQENYSVQACIDGKWTFVMPDDKEKEV